MHRQHIAFILVTLIAALPNASFAQTTPAPGSAEARAQVESLSALVLKLQSQINDLLRIQHVTATPIPATLISPNGELMYKPRICDTLDRNLSRGMENEDVGYMQEFLKEKGFFDGEATGFFGAKTEAALKAYQVSEGLPGVGAFGPRTRTLILAVHCTGTSTPAVMPQHESTSSEE